MKLFYSPYVLKKKKKFGDETLAYTSGVLLKVEWPEGIIGYSDLHPLKFLGDVDIVEEIERLRSGKLSYPAEQSIWFARRDGEARKSKKSLLEGIQQ
ncbi:MAG TPA: hypothetical protein PLJ21_08650, partial [Pseudobdellovibrionaceae bacterium]|nr:hypothetical protein [Pseudobdellovibrionaceae bacterium]